MKKYVITLILLVFVGAETWARPTLTVYSGRHNKFVKPVMKEFTRLTGIKVILHNAKASALITRMKLEGRKTRADVFISNDAGSLQIGSDLGLFKPMDSKLLAVVPSNYKAKDNTWTGLSARARVLVINTTFKNDLLFVRSVFDLSNRRLLGKLAVTHSANGSFVAGITVYQKVAGDKKTLEFLQGLKINTAGKVYNKHSKIVKDVAEGKKIIGLVNHYYVYRHLKKHPKAPLEVIFPDQGKNGIGVALNVTGIAISKHTKKTRLAKKLVRFLLSKRGQYLFASQNREYPVRSDVKTTKELPSLKSFRVADVPMAELGKMRNKTLSLIEKVGLY